MRLRRVASVLGEVLVTAGVVVLLFLAWQLWWTDVAADRAHASSVSSLAQDFAAPTRPSTGSSTAAPVIAGDAFAIIRVPRFGEDYARPLVEGTSAKELAGGFGHYVGTAGAGEVGNFAIAGHRNTYGKPLADIDKLRDGDRIIVETRAGWSVYAVTGHEIVRPWQSEVIAPVPGDRAATPTQKLLTFTACHPKFSAKYRWIVHAELVESRTRAQGAPSSAVSVGAS